MNGRIIRLDSLIRQARQEAVPTLDVSHHVAVAIQARVSAPRIDRSLWAAAGLSVVTAAAVLLLSVQLDAFFLEPLTEWLRPLTMVMQ